MTQRSPLVFEIGCQLSMWAFWVASVIVLAGKQLQHEWLQVVGILLLVVSVSFALYFALEARRRKPVVVTAAIRRIRFASSTAFLFSVVIVLFVLAVHANHARAWTTFTIISVPLLAKFFWEMYHRKV
jgi:hypothetical protein